MLKAIRDHFASRAATAAIKAAERRVYLDNPEDMAHAQALIDSLTADRMSVDPMEQRIVAAQHDFEAMRNPIDSIREALGYAKGLGDQDTVSTLAEALSLVQKANTKETGQ